MVNEKKKKTLVISHFILDEDPDLLIWPIEPQNTLSLPISNTHTHTHHEILQCALAIVKTFYEAFVHMYIHTHVYEFALRSHFSASPGHKTSHPDLLCRHLLLLLSVLTLTVHSAHGGRLSKAPF